MGGNKSHAYHDGGFKARAVGHIRQNRELGDRKPVRKIPTGEESARGPVFKKEENYRKSKRPPRRHAQPSRDVRKGPFRLSGGTNKNEGNKNIMPEHMAKGV